MIHIDLEACTGCRACEKDCPGRAIQVTDGKARSVKKCILCGHCVAICPQNAVSIPDYDMEDVEEYDPKTFHLNPDTYLHAVKFRRSIRNFTDKPISRDQMEQILKAGRYTATARNSQDCRFILVQERLEEFRNLVWQEMPEVLRHLQTEDRSWHYLFSRFYKKYQQNPADDTLLFNCTSFLVIAADNLLDGGLAASNIENMAVAEGAGVLYSGYMMRMLQESSTLKKWLEIGDRHISCCMLLGYPRMTYRRTAPRRKADIIWK